MLKFHIVLSVRAVSCPHDLRLETSAVSEKAAINNAVYLLRTYGHVAFNVPKMRFKPHLDRFNMLYKANPESVVKIISPDDEIWLRCLDLRAYIPERHRELNHAHA